MPLRFRFHPGFPRLGQLTLALLFFLAYSGQATASNDHGDEPLSRIALGRGAEEPLIVNPSFEVDSFDVFPGYVTQNGPVTGWEGGVLGNAGLNPISDGQSPFADNGAIPDGNQVGFLQSNPSGEARLATLMTGLVPGSSYNVRFRTNARSSSASVRLQVEVSGELIETSLNGAPPSLAQDIVPVGGLNPYHRISLFFTSVASSQALTIINAQGGDNTVLVDDFQLFGERIFADRFILTSATLGFEGFPTGLLAQGSVNSDGPFLVETVTGTQWAIRILGNPGNMLAVGLTELPMLNDVISIRRADGLQFLIESLDFRSRASEQSDSLELIGLINGQAVVSVGGITSAVTSWQTLQPVFDVPVDEVLFRVEVVGSASLYLDNMVVDLLAD